MDIITKQRETFFNNLLILGLDRTSIEKKYRLTLDKDMFCIPNQKTFEVVTHFLFSKLNQVSSKKYSLPWPVLDKDQHRQFQKSCFNHLTAIALESNVKFPRFVSSLISTFSGDRFYELYLAFSNHVIQKTIMKKNKAPLVTVPTLTHENSQDFAEVLRLSRIMSVEKFQVAQRFSLRQLHLYMMCSQKFASNVKNFQMKITTNTSLLERNIKTLFDLYCNDQSETCPLSEIIKKSIKYEKKVKDNWSSLNEFFLKESKLWNCVCSLVEENHKTFCLDGANFKLVISEDIKRICPEINEVDCIKSEEKENLSMAKYLELFYILLQFYMKTTVKRELFETSELLVLKNVSSVEENLKHIKSLNNNLVQNILPSMRSSIENLEANAYLKECSDDLEDFLKQCPSFSCCTANFQNQTNNFRIDRFLNSKPTDIATRSCLLSDKTTQFSGDESLILRSSECILSRTTNKECDSDQPSNVAASHLYQENNFLDKQIRDISTIHGNESDSDFSLGMNFTDFETNAEQSISNSNSCPIIKLTEDSPKFIPSSCITDFKIQEDADQPFKWRESWHMEDSLNAMTLPDLPDIE